MSITRLTLGAVLGAATLIANPALARETAAPAVVTEGRVATPAGPADYEASVFEIVVETEQGEPAAALGGIDYVLLGEGDPADRPVTFFFNGGPGSSSVWLHMGFAGPRRAPLATEDVDGVLVDNDHSILDTTDLVFVDPVGTGFSRALGSIDEEAFWNVDTDAASVAAFVNRYLEANDRRESPVYIAGESYGAIRAAMMIEHLEEAEKQIRLEGVILISPAMHTRLVTGNGGAERSVMHLPSYTAVAHHYGMLDDRFDSLAEAVTDATIFARTDYKEALLEWDTLNVDERRAIVERVSELTGVRRSRVAREGAQLSRSEFLAEVRRETDRRVDTMDATRPARNAQGSLRDRFGSSLKEYLDEEIGRLDGRKYRIFNSRANSRWRGPDRSEHLFAQAFGIMPLLEGAMARNEELRLFTAGGVYDLVTPFGEAPYLLGSSEIDADRVTIEAYEGGHMMYLREDSLERLAADLRAFIDPVQAE